MNKNLFGLLALLTLVVVILAACTQAATPVPPTITLLASDIPMPTSVPTLAPTSLESTIISPTVPSAFLGMSFVSSEQTLGSDPFSDVVFGDVDGDGDADLLAAGDPNQLWINDGKGNFAISEQSLGVQATGVALGDLNGDETLDAFITYLDTNEVWLNDGKGNYTNSGQQIGNRLSTSVALADLDGDGDLDAFVSSATKYLNGKNVEGENQIWLNDGKGKFNDSGQAMTNGEHIRVHLGDIDGDGDIDALVAAYSNYQGAANENEIWINDGNAHFARKILSTPLSLDLAPGDLDGDGDLDALVTYLDDAYGVGAVILLNDGMGNFIASQQGFDDASCVGVALGDLDRDGDLDAILIGGTYTEPLPGKIWTNDGNGNFTESGVNFGSDTSHIVRLADIDGDGDLDAFVGDKIWLNATGEEGGAAQTENAVDVYASYFGASAGEYNTSIAVDASGYVVLAGHTYSTDFPLQAPLQANFGGGDPRADAFVTKLTPDLSTIVFSTYLGGSDYDEIKDVILDRAGNIYVTGLTESQDFPVSEHALDTSYNGGDYDAFLTKISPDGELLYSTFIGGDQAEIGCAITADDDQNIYIAGSSASTNFPTKSAISTTLGGREDVFLFKFDAKNNSLVFSTYLGGSANDYSSGIFVDSAANIYLSGITESADFPIQQAFDSDLVEAGTNTRPIWPVTARPFISAVSQTRRTSRPPPVR